MEKIYKLVNQIEKDVKNRSFTGCTIDLAGREFEILKSLLEERGLTFKQAHEGLPNLYVFYKADYEPKKAKEKLDLIKKKLESNPNLGLKKPQEKPAPRRSPFELDDDDDERW